MTDDHYFADYPYLDVLDMILHKGHIKGDRTGTGTLSLFGAQMQFDLRSGFPLLTTKKLPFRWIARELMWFLSGSCDEGDLRKHGVDIWKEWATEEQCARFGRKAGDLGPIYSHQWRNFGATEDYDEHGPLMSYDDNGIDQIEAALDMLANNPDSRRIIVTGWNPAEATQVALPPCHTMFQFGTHLQRVKPGEEMPKDKLIYANADGSVSHRVLSCHMYQRSADVFLGVPFNIASYALLTHMFAHVLGYDVGTLTISFGDVHIYQNHMHQVAEQMGRKPKPSPTLRIRTDPHTEHCLDGDDRNLLQQLLDIDYDDLSLLDYNPHPKIKAEVSV